MFATCFRMTALLAALLLAPVAAAATAACGMATPGATTRIAVEPGGRAMLVHFPSRQDPARRAPLVFLLHGSGGTGAEILRHSRLAEAADRHGFILAAPDGGIAVDKGFVWNIPGVPTITGKVPGPGEADDVAFITRAIDWMTAQGCVDPARVYATGLSGGGRMTSWLGCVAADRFAAIAPVVGLRAGNPLAGLPRLPDPATCMPTRPMPVIAFAGDKDRTNPIQGGGAGYWQYTMHAALARWADLNLCRRGPLVRDLSDSLYEERYADCRGRAQVVARISRGRGHEWVADNDALWAFFARHRR